MDWKHAHYSQDCLFRAPHDAVLAATRKMVDDVVPGWSRRHVDDGVDVAGSSASHHAEAKIRLSPAPEGTNVSIQMLVQRSSPLGFMLFDIGGYYQGLLGKWMHGIWTVLGAGAQPHGAVAPNAQIGSRVALFDPQGAPHVGVVRQVNGAQVLVTLDAGGEAWVHVANAHLI